MVAEGACLDASAASRASRWLLRAPALMPQCCKYIIKVVAEGACLDVSAARSIKYINKVVAEGSCLDVSAASKASRWQPRAPA